MRTLAIDTSFGTSVAVLENAETLAQLDYLENMSHSERIGTAIDDVLVKAKLVPADIDRVVVGVGPGPFTGLRIGISAAKFFAMGIQAELVGVCSLDAIAFDYYQSHSGDLLVTTDARRKELFWAKYSHLDLGVPVRVAGPFVSRPEDIESEGFEQTELHVSAAALGKIAFALGARASHDVSPIYLREPDATPGKGKKVSG